MDPAIWGFIGTAIGAALTILGNLALHTTERSARRREEAAAAQARMRDERKLAYLRLLSAARKLRYVAREPSEESKKDLDSLRTELSTVQYEIELIAPTAVVTRANTLRRSTLDYLNAALIQADPEAIDAHRKSSRRAVSALVSAARVDLAIASDNWPSTRHAPRRQTVSAHRDEAKAE